MNQSIRVRVIGILSAGVMSALAVPANALDHVRSVMSPTASQAESSTSLAKLSYAAGKVFNSSSSGNAYVWCPIIRKETSLEDEFVDQTSSRISYVDSSSSNLSCTYYWNFLDTGAPYWSWTYASSGSGGPGSFDADDPEVFWGTKTWRCSLPTASSVYLTGFWHIETTY